MSVLSANRVHEVATVYRRSGQVLKDAPRVCPPPMRTKEQKRTKRSQDKPRSNRLAALTRPTISSRAKERNKTLSPAPTKDTLKEGKSEKKTKKTKSSSKKALKVHVESVTPVLCDASSARDSETKSSGYESPFMDARAECDSDVYFFDKRDLNPLLYDVGDFVFDSFSEDSFSSISCSSSLSSSCLDFEESQKRERWNRLLSLTHSVACAVSFAAGLTLGMAIGACNLVQSPQSS